ncbi:MAG TPA: hypothetical protein HPQ04_09670 [Rhodospirillaceae bacterium]|nr:hypothetical protein [Rhodospirillaceae bacterium]
MTPNLPKPPPKLPPKAPPKALVSAVTLATAQVAPTKTQPLVQAAAAAPASPIPGLPPLLAAMAEAIRIYDAILVEENTLLRRQNVKGVAALLDKKQKATVLYQERLRGTLTEAENLTKLPPEQSVALAKLANDLRSHIEENAALLKGSMHALERMFGVVNEAVRKDRERQVTYSANGRVDGPPVTNSAIAFNSNA